MNWYIVIAVIVGLFVIYKLSTAKPRKVVNIIADSLGIKSHFVDNMLVDMGAEQGKSFVNSISSWGDRENHGVYTFIVYQVMKNDSEQNIKWWKSKLVENNIEPNMDLGAAEIAFVYLSDAGADFSRVRNFLNVYNNIC